MQLKLFIITFLAIVGAHKSIYMDSSPHHCPLLIKNTSASPIWISQNPLLKEKLTINDLEQSRAQVIQPYDIAPINVGSVFTVYTRSPHSNTNYQRGITVVQRSCDPANDEYVIDFSLFETAQADPARFIVINHTKEKDIPEATHPICPGGSLPELDEETNQWFCKVYRYSDVYEKYVDEYVPVLSYIYQWLPSSIWTQWYIKNPYFYNWYHKHPDFYSHLEHYQAPWQTKEYALWYSQQPEKVRLTVRPPEQPETAVATTQGKPTNPIGLPEYKIKTKAAVQSAYETNISKESETKPQILIYSKEQKKQAIEDIVSSTTHTQQLKSEDLVEVERNKKHVNHTRMLKSYDTAKLSGKKPMAISKTGVIATQMGKRRIIL